MAGARHLLLVLLAVAGLVSALSVSSAAIACPSAPLVAPAPHHGGCGHSAPASQPSPSTPLCAACIAVLPPLPTAERQRIAPFTPYATTLHSLSGVDPALDPPPPRAA